MRGRARGGEGAAPATNGGGGGLGEGREKRGVYKGGEHLGGGASSGGGGTDSRVRHGHGGGAPVLGKERATGWAGARLGFGPVGRRAFFLIRSAENNS